MVRVLDKPPVPTYAVQVLIRLLSFLILYISFVRISCYIYSFFVQEITGQLPV